MRLTLLSFIFILTIPQLSFSQNEIENTSLKEIGLLTKKNDSLLDLIEVLQLKNDEFDYKFESQMNLYDTSFIAISSQLETLNTFLTYSSIFIAIFGIFIAYYVNNMQAKTSSLLDKTLKAKEEVKLVQKDIQGNFDLIYSSIKEKEINLAFKNIRKKPKMIYHYSSMINTGVLNYNHYIILKEIIISFFEKEGFKEENDLVEADISYYFAILNGSFSEKLLGDNYLISLLKSVWKYFVVYSDKSELIEFYLNYGKKINNEGINEEDLKQFSMDLEDILFDHRFISAEKIYENLNSKVIKLKIIEKCKGNNIDFWAEKFQDLFDKEYN